MIKVDLKGCENFVERNNFETYVSRAREAHRTLMQGTGKGNDFIGWLHLPSRTGKNITDACLGVVERWIGMQIDLVVVIGIGGSYLGAKAAIEALNHSFAPYLERTPAPQVVFAGQNLSEDYAAELMDLVSIRNVACVVISKSGTTTEPAVAFRLVKKHIEEKYGSEEARLRIVAVTDKARGALKSLSDTEGYTTFVIEDSVGGRYSVLSPVGLLPIALAGFDIEAMMEGAVSAEETLSNCSAENPAILYAAMRNALYDSGKKVELLACFNPKMQYVGEWFKQLFGESEGKDGKGIFPASAIFTTDLHSMGQYIQQGERILFETILTVASQRRNITIESDGANLDGLDFLAGKRVEHCNRMAQAGTRLAHIDGGVPNIEITLERVDERCLGELFYFFEVACAVSAYMLGINPFNQPGVEDYKKNMFALLEKPGYEEASAAIKSRL